MKLPSITKKAKKLKRKRKKKTAIGLDHKKRRESINIAKEHRAAQNKMEKLWRYYNLTTNKKQ